MRIAQTLGEVSALKAKTVGYAASKRVVGTTVTVTTMTPDDESGTVEVESDIFLAPNSILPEMGSKVVIIIADEAALEGIGSDVPSALGWMATGEEPDNE